MKQGRILLIEKDRAVKADVTSALEEAGFEVTTADDGLEGLMRLYENHPDLVIVDNELPTVNGEAPCLRLRQASYLPIIVLGDDDDGAEETLELGADAYMTRPPGLAELMGRVSALLRRRGRMTPPVLELGEPDEHSEGGSNGLTTIESRLASCLILNEGRVVSHQQLITEAWAGKEVSLETLHSHMRRLRKKLRDGRIFILRGVGYCFKLDQTKINLARHA